MLSIQSFISRVRGWIPILALIASLLVPAVAAFASPSCVGISSPSAFNGTTTFSNVPINGLQIEADMVDQVNQVRAQYGRPPMTSNAALAEAARGHSHDMAVNNYVNHDT